ncbi:putative PQ loop repeat protein [Paratrimastix pyriformis]|uniref:PQ loop repeat protein n=1 Tax=Paratrimastix pyriformis TaxID=342808 RepID=A0ABQ8UTJ3_9EUKA|nr:putative PQ loop repeat protein [Paratrimastix pyriformis]
MVGTVASILPQIIELIRRRSGVGLSIWMMLLALLATGTLLANMLVFKWYQFRGCAQVGFVGCSPSLFGFYQNIIFFVGYSGIFISYLVCNWLDHKRRKAPGTADAGPLQASLSANHLTSTSCIVTVLNRKEAPEMPFVEISLPTGSPIERGVFKRVVVPDPSTEPLLASTGEDEEASGIGAIEYTTSSPQHLSAPAVVATAPEEAALHPGQHLPDTTSSQAQPYLFPIRGSLWVFLFALLGPVLFCVVPTSIFIGGRGPCETSIIVYAQVMGILSVICNIVQWSPQIWKTWRLKSKGSLSIIMLALNTPGSFLILFYLAVIEKNGVFTWISFLAAGSQQLFLLVLVIIFEVRRSRAARRAAGFL